MSFKTIVSLIGCNVKFPSSSDEKGSLYSIVEKTRTNLHEENNVLFHEKVNYKCGIIIQTKS